MTLLRPALRTRRLVHAGTIKLAIVMFIELTTLLLDLVAGPAGSLLGALGVLLVPTNVACHLGEPVCAEEVGELAVREGLGDVAVMCQ